jgi:hypothetical protein
MANENDRSEDDAFDFETKCQRLLGSHVLAKSCIDTFDYVMKLSTGEQIRYESATVLADDWLHLSEACDFPHGPEYPRGIDVRVSAIVWVKDAPFGS